MECTAFINHAFHPDAAPHHFHERPGYVQSKAVAGHSGQIRPFHPMETSEKFGDFLFGYPEPLV